MKGLTLIRPWDFAMLHGKDVENRKWAPWPEAIGQRIALHAGSKYDAHAETFIRARGVDLPDQSLSIPGQIVGVTTVAGWVSKDAEGSGLFGFLYGGNITSDEAQAALESRWFMGPFGWVVRDTVALATPVACKGALGLWRLPLAVEALVNAQIARAA